MYKFGKYSDIILKEMAKRVGAKLSDVGEGDKWYQEYEWTQEESDSYKKWLEDYLYKNRSKFKGEFVITSSTSKKRIKQLANMFVFQYGWSSKEN